MARRPAAPPQDLNTSTSFSRQRFAHPFFLPAPPDKRQAFDGARRMTHCSKTQLGPVPPARGDGVMNLADTQRIGGNQVSYIVVGTGGITPHPVPDATGQPAGVDNQATYDAATESLGDLLVADCRGLAILSPSISPRTS
jgi:hypothetical protein